MLTHDGAQFALKSERSLSYLRHGERENSIRHILKSDEE